MHPRRPFLKRAIVWTGAVVLLLVSYVLGAPFVAFFASRYVPRSEPLFVAVYAPLVYVSRDPDAPGHSEFTAYCQWCQSMIEQAGQ